LKESRAGFRLQLESTGIRQAAGHVGNDRHFFAVGGTEDETVNENGGGMSQEFHEAFTVCVFFVPIQRGRLSLLPAKRTEPQPADTKRKKAPAKTGAKSPNNRIEPTPRKARLNRLPVRLNGVGDQTTTETLVIAFELPDAAIMRTYVS
jgi:hypothetical protein